MLAWVKKEGGLYSSLVIEFAFWVVVPLFFIFTYVFFFYASVIVIWPHLMIVWCGWIGFFCFRLFCWRCLGRGRFQRCLNVALLLCPPLMLFSWYLVVLLGLISWGRLATWPMVELYFSQAGFLLDVLGVSWVLVFFLMFLLFLLVYVFFVFIDFVDLGFFIARQMTVMGGVFFSLLGGALLCSVFFYLPSFAYEYPSEPISGGFFPGRLTSFQSNFLSASAELVTAEVSSRKFYTPSSEYDRRNVILIVGDALRADHMGAYGYSRSTTPYLDESVRVHQTFFAERARSVCAESFCGLMAITSSRPLHLLVANPITLHEVLRKHGYRVQMVLSGDHTNFYGLKDWYGQVDEYFDGASQSRRYINDDKLLTDYVGTLPQYDGGKPVFFQFHLMSAHGLGRRHESSGMFLPMSNYYKWPSASPRAAPSTDDALKAINYYDSGVRQFDRLLNDILVELEAKGYLDNAVVVIVGDHGEMLGEADHFGHQYSVDESVLQIPLIIQRRGYRGEALVGRPLVSQVDVAPTILYELGLNAPDVWRGMALQMPDVPRRIYFQQTPWVGFYDVGSYGGPVKYWMNIKSGDEYLLDIVGAERSRSQALEDFEPDVRREWRRVVIKNSGFQ